MKVLRTALSAMLLLTSGNVATARYMEPATGRFLTSDPLPLAVDSNLYSEEALREPQRLHRYAYALNNPIRYTDPYGLFAFPGGWCNEPDVMKVSRLLQKCQTNRYLQKFFATKLGVPRQAFLEMFRPGTPPHIVFGGFQSVDKTGGVRALGRFDPGSPDHIRLANEFRYYNYPADFMALTVLHEMGHYAFHKYDPTGFARPHPFGQQLQIETSQGVKTLNVFSNRDFRGHLEGYAAEAAGFPELYERYKYGPPK